MIEALNTIVATEPRRADKAPETGGNPSFSYALAAASLETQAGASLKAHGGAPEGATEMALGDQARAPNESEPARTRQEGQKPAFSEQSPAPEATRRDSAATSGSSSSVVESLGESRSANAPQNSILALAEPSVAHTGAAQTAQPVAARSEQLAALREIAARSSSEARKSAPADPPRHPQGATQDFARLLARRLEGGASEFELRLDPPELGRVEAKLALGEEGKAILALKFDNQAALDLFSRDEAQLRAALLLAGFDSGGADISFSLNERSSEPVLAERSPAASFPIASEHSFLAPVSSGVMDISV